MTGGLSVTSAGGVGYTFDQDIGGTETTATGTLYNCPAPTTAVANCITVKSFTADLAGEGTISSGGHYRFQVNTAPTTGTARLSVTALQASTSIGGAAAGSGTPGGATGSVQTNAGGGSFGGLAPGADDTVIKASGGAWIVGAAPGGGGGLTDPGSNGMLSRTALNTTVARTITGDAEIVVMDGDGVSGNPTLSIGAGIARDSEVAAVELGDLANVTETGWADGEIMIRQAGTYGGVFLPPDSVDDVDTPADEECATYEATGPQWEWQPCGTDDQLAAEVPFTVDDTNEWPGADPTEVDAALELLVARLVAEEAAADGGAGSDTSAIHDDTAGEIAAVTEKATPTTSDLALLEDAADSNNKKRATVGNILAAGTDLNSTGEVIGGSADDLDQDLDGNPEVYSTSPGASGVVSVDPSNNGTNAFCDFNAATNQLVCDLDQDGTDDVTFSLADSGGSLELDETAAPEFFILKDGTANEGDHGVTVAADANLDGNVRYTLGDHYETEEQTAFTGTVGAGSRRLQPRSDGWYEQDSAAGVRRLATVEGDLDGRPQVLAAGTTDPTNSTVDCITAGDIYPWSSENTLFRCTDAASDSWAPLTKDSREFYIEDLDPSTVGADTCLTNTRFDGVPGSCGQFQDNIDRQGFIYEGALYGGSIACWLWDVASGADAGDQFLIGWRAHTDTAETTDLDSTANVTIELTAEEEGYSADLNFERLHDPDVAVSRLRVHSVTDTGTALGLVQARCTFTFYY